LSSEKQDSFKAESEIALREQGFDHFGFARLEKPLSIGLYESWLEKGHHGEMNYLRTHLDEKREPQRLLKRATSAIVVTLNYVPHPKPVEKWPLSASVQIAAYAQGTDYHFVLKHRLSKVIEHLQRFFPTEEFLCFADSSPVLERDLAVRAGLGWIGKNTCLISRKKGSLFFIGEIYTTFDFPVAQLYVHDHCGTCTRCIDACPTQALVAPRELDARRCISYLTIESRRVAPEALRTPIGNWLFGCDICQTVCPWNIKLAVTENRALAGSRDESRAEIIADLRFLLTSSNRAIEKAFAGTPLLRAGGWALKRNALVVAGNLKAVELQNEIRTFIGHAKLHELALWALKQIS